MQQHPKKNSFNHAILASTCFALFSSTASVAMSEKPDIDLSQAAFDQKSLERAEEVVANSWTRSTPKERERLVQDYSNKVCSAYKDKPTPELSKKLTEYNRSLIQYPPEGIKLGNWKKGEKLAISGYGMRIGKIKPDDPKKKPNGGNCYACHALAPDEPAAGNLGPKLTNYGQRGTSQAVLKYTYEKIYNAHAFYACSGMPRFGVNGVLNSQQIADIMAFLLDPKSPVNQK